jgi:Cu/Zn superoxide dismutase
MSETTRMTNLKVMAIASSMVFASLASMAILIPKDPLTIAAYAQQQSQTFTAKLSGKDEVPPVNTQATGTAQFQLSSDGKDLNYDLSTNLQGFMMAHIHKGKSGENGQPITSSDLQGSLAGKQISDLVDLMKNGGAYVNVHTNQNQNGEIRGQIMSG